LTLSGAANAGETVTIYIDNVAVGTVIASGTTGTGSWTFIIPSTLPAGLSSPLTQGQHTYTVSAANNGGQTQTSAGYIVTYDSAATAGTLTFSNQTDSGTQGDGKTNDNSFDLTLTGNEAGTVVYQVSKDGGSTWTTTQAAQSSLVDGSYQFRAVVTDAAGNTANTAPISAVIDTVATAGTLTFANQLDSGTQGDGKTNDNSFDLSLTGNEAGSSVAYQVSKDGGAFTATTAAQANLADGSYQFRAVVTDAAGNTANTAPISAVIDTAPTNESASCYA